MSLVSANSAIHSAQRILEAIQADAPIYRAIQDQDPRLALTGMNVFSKQNVIRTQLMAHQWRKIGRKVLAMHPEVVEEVRVAVSDKIPTDHLFALPFLNPMVVFAEPPVFKTWVKSGQTHFATDKGKVETHMRLLGFLTCGIADGLVTVEGSPPRIEQRIHSTSDTHADRFGVLLVMEPLDELGKVVGTEFNTVTLRYGKELTLAETVEDVLGRFHWDDEDSMDTKRGQRWMRDILSVVIGSLFYLCSTTMEAEPVPARSVAKKIPKRVIRAPISFYKVGWTTGTAISRIRQERASAWKESEQADITHEQDPQHRRAHFKMQWYGPRAGLRCVNLRSQCACGGQHREMIFVSAYWTKVDKLGEAGMNMAHVVPSLGKGQPRESVKVALTAPPTERD